MSSHCPWFRLLARHSTRYSVEFSPRPTKKTNLTVSDATCEVILNCRHAEQFPLCDLGYNIHISGFSYNVKPHPNYASEEFLFNLTSQYYSFVSRHDLSCEIISYHHYSPLPLGVRRNVIRRDATKSSSLSTFRFSRCKLTVLCIMTIAFILRNTWVIDAIILTCRDKEKTAQLQMKKKLPYED